MKRFQKVEAFTGLEAAIVLIAFVVVAAVFSYVVLGAGFFTAQQAQKVVYSGIGQATSNILIMGQVYGDASGTAQGSLGVGSTNPGSIHTLVFTIGLAAGATPVSINTTTFKFQNETILQTLSPASNICGNSGAQPAAWQWEIQSWQNGNCNNGLLEPGVQFTIEANVSVSPQTISTGIPPGDTFTLQIIPPVGAALPITKTAPGSITPMNVLY